MIETSLRTYLKYLYMAYPSKTQIKVNGRLVDLENPYFK